jgi:methyl-accepting chemotaxis protein
MKVATRILIPTVGLSAVIVVVSGVAIGLQREVADAARQAAAASSQMIEAGEVRSLSRAIQREALKLISPAWSAGGEGLQDSINAGGAQLIDRAKALVATLGPGDDDMKQQFVDLQQKVVAALGAVKDAAVAGDIDKAQYEFQRNVQPADAEASELTDSFIDGTAKRVAALSTANDRVQWVSFAALLALSAGSLLAGLGGSLWVVRRGVTRPLHGLVEGLRQLASGNYDVAVAGLGRGDEIGEIAAAAEHLKNEALERQRMATERAEAQEQTRRRERAEAEAVAARAAEQKTVVAELGRALTTLAQKDLTHRITATLPDAYRQLQIDFNAAIAQLAEAFAGVDASTNAVDSGTREIATAFGDLSQRTEQQAAGLDETAATLEEITTTVRKTADGAQHARQVVASAGEDATRGAEVVRRAVEAMGKIEASSQQISRIIGVIDEIAFQTNLLALNAAVEAGRAGETGRGFAVVAAEVRALAQRCADAAKQIKGLISTSTTQVAEGVDLVAQTGAALERIEVEVGEINGVVAEIVASAEEQATGIQHINVAVAQMDQATQQNAAMSEETTAASRSLVEESARLASLVAQFQIGRDSAAASRRARVKTAARGASPSATPNAAAA